MTGILGLILFVLLLIVGGERGAIAVMALVGNIAVLALLVFLMSGGHSPLLLTFLACIAISYITLFKQNGNNLKTKAAFNATLIVMGALVIVIFITVWASKAGGLNEIQAIQEDVMFYYSVDIDTNMMHVAVCMVLLSTMGAVTDTALAVSSSVYEVYSHNPGLSVRELFHSGMQIGREIIGTTINTLLFAYLGESMLLFAYLKTGKFTLETIINSKFLFEGTAVMLFGGIACLGAVPVTAVCISRMLEKKNELCK